MVSLNVSVATMTVTLSLLLLVSGLPSSPPSSSSSSSFHVHHVSPFVAITSGTNDPIDMSTTTSLSSSHCRWGTWNKTGYFCAAAIQQQRDEFAAVTTGTLATYRMYFTGLEGEIDCLTLSYQAGLRFTLQVYSTGVTRQSMNINRLDRGDNSRVCPSASYDDRASCTESQDCLVADLSTSCQPLFTGAAWNTDAFMSYRVHFVQNGTVTFVMKVMNDTCPYQWRASEDAWSACPSDRECGNYTSTRRIDCITDTAFGTRPDGSAVGLSSSYGCVASAGSSPATSKACPNAACSTNDDSSQTFIGIPLLIVYIVAPIIAIVIGICCYFTIRSVRRARQRAAADAAYAMFDYPLMMSETANINGDNDDDSQ